MKKKLLIGFVISALFLAGCGDAAYELTAEEQSQIVTYAAHAINRFNIYQKDGETYIDKKYLVEPVEEKDEKSSEETEKTESAENTSEVENKPGTEVKEEKPKYQMTTFAEVVHNSEVAVTYEGNYLADSFVEEGVYALDAAANKTFLVMEIKIKNDSTTGQLVDIDSQTPQFSIEYAGSKKAKAKTTILPKDFSTYSGEISAGKEENLVMLFEISKEDSEHVGEINLLFKVDSTTKQIALK